MGTILRKSNSWIDMNDICTAQLSCLWPEHVVRRYIDGRLQMRIVCAMVVFGGGDTRGWDLGRGSKLVSWVCGEVHYYSWIFFLVCGKK